MPNGEFNSKIGGNERANAMAKRRFGSSADRKHEQHNHKRDACKSDAADTVRLLILAGVGSAQWREKGNGALNDHIAIKRKVGD